MLTEPLCKDRDCLIVGSAPGVWFPPNTGQLVIGANGGAALARDAGFDVGVLCTTSYLYRNDASDSDIRTREAMLGLQVISVWLDVKHDHWKDFVFWNHSGISYSVFASVDPDYRENVISKACNDVPLWPSTGVWAACLAVVSGPRTITITGIGLSTGHEGMPNDNEPRYHVEEDRAVLEVLRGEPNVTVLEPRR